MRRQKEFTVKFFVGLLILSSIIFAACEPAANTSVSQKQEGQPDYSRTSNANAASNTKAMQHIYISVIILIKWLSP